MACQASSLMAAIAARTVSVCRTVIENRRSWRRQAVSTLADQKPESASRRRAAGAGAADPPGQFVDEPLGTAARGGPASVLSGVQHLAGVGPGGQQRVVSRGQPVEEKHQP